MAESSTEPAAAGVQNLIDRIRDDGVKAGKEEADKILREAEQKAARLIGDARAKAKHSMEEARGKIASERHAAEEALKLAARDTIKDLGLNVRAAFERQLRRLVTEDLEDEGFLRQVILALAGQSARDTIQDRAVEILLSEDLAGEAAGADSGESEAEARIRSFILDVSGDALREGIEFKLDPSIDRGVSVRLVGEEMRIDLDDDTITEFLVRHLLPRYRRILAGQDSNSLAEPSSEETS